MDDIKKVLLETLCDFHDFCEKHNLEYFLIGGTLLGAVRHKGFIPWDDDIDIVMPRKDYDKLNKLYKEFSYPLKLRSSKSEPHFRMPFSKLVNEKIIVEEDAFKPFISGVWLDIFPLDSTFEIHLLQKLHFSFLQKVKLLLALKYNTVDFSKRSPLKKLVLLNLKKISKLISIRELNALMYVVETAPSTIFRRDKYVANLHGFWGIKELAPKTIFENKELYSFESFKFWGPKDANYWLERVYGNYMQLPPIEKRKSPHLVRILNNELNSIQD